MGQVWSKANFDGTNISRHLGGRGSVLAVTAQDPGPDGRYGTGDDVLAPLNSTPVSVSIDAAPGADCEDSRDRVRGFIASIAAERTSYSPMFLSDSLLMTFLRRRIGH